MSDFGGQKPVVAGTAAATALRWEKYSAPILALDRVCLLFCNTFGRSNTRHEELVREFQTHW
jgi:hypothetical protein